jgi:hypothetical protein
VSNAAAPEDIANALNALRQLVFAGLVASAKTATQASDQEEAWNRMTEADGELIDLINRISPGAVVR